MAKLPEIRTTQVSLPKGRGPGEALQEAKGIAQVSNAITESVLLVNEANREYKYDQAKIQSQNDLLAFDKNLAGKEYWSADEVRELGLEGQIDIMDKDDAGATIDRQKIPRHEVYPLLLQEQMGRTLRQRSNGVSSVDRDRWFSEMNTAKEKVITDAVIKAREQAVDWTLQARQQDIAEAQAIGNYDGADALIRKAYTNPALRDEALQKNAVTREAAKYHQVIAQRTAAEIELAADQLEDMDLEDTPYDSKQRAAQVSTLRTAATSKRTADDAALAKIHGKNFALTIAGVASGSMSTNDVIDNIDMYDPKDFASLVKYSQSQETSKVTGAAAHVEVIETNMTIGLQLAKEGVYPEGVGTREEAQRYFQNLAINNATQLDPTTGEVIPGLNASQVTTLMATIDDLEDITFETRGYKELTDEMRLRILRTSDSGPSWIPTPDSASLMANAMNDLHTFIRTEEAAGREPNLAQWKTDRMPAHLNKTAQQAFFKITDPKVQAAVVFHTDASGRFTVDKNATLEKINDTFRGGNQQDREKVILKFDTWWRAHGENVGAK